MIKNYLKIAWRNLVNNRVYSALNILGLAAGMAVALLIGLWVANEFSYDKFLPDYKSLYQVELNFTDPHEGEHTQQAVSLPIADVLRKEYPEVKYVAETDWMGQHDLLVGTKKLYMNGAAIGSDFLKMFQYPLIKGNKNDVLKDPFSIVLTESTAKALFGNTDPMGKLVKVDNKYNLKVTGIMNDIPKNSTLQFNYLMPFSFNEATQDWMKNARSTYYNNSFQIFVQLKPGVDYATLAPKIRNIVYNGGPKMRPVKPVVLLHPVADWHLYADFKNGKEVGGFIDYVRMFSIIGILVLLIACINFMNLSTARSEKRAREVGVRKAIGSQRKDLIFQFLTESVLITFIAFLFSVLFTQLALPSFNSLTGSEVRIAYSSPLFWIVMILYVLITGLLAGSRPAFYLSSFNPVKVLKGTIQIGKAAALPRKILVVLQFSCSIALIISTIIVYQQIQYAKDRPTGYSADRLVTTDMSDDLNNHYDALKNDLLATGIVESVARASSPITGVYWHTGIEKWPGQGVGELGINVGAVSVSDSYFKTVGMKLAKGRDFLTNWSADTSNIIINEAAVRRMGLKEPLNQLVTFDGINGQAKIVGVVKDALMESPFTPVEPTVFVHGRGSNFALYRLSQRTNTHDAIEKIGKIFDKYNPAYPFSYRFVDDEYNGKFNLEVLVGKLAGIFAGLAIFISCLGLFGLAAYVAEQRTKEIGIRKVLGASITQVWLLLSRDFILLVMISCVIACPVALYFLGNWLRKYDYRITIGPGVFMLAAVVALVITILTISFQAIKAALSNPVKSLRSE
ncbi:ABC transporter permease [Mucilaginibacter gotjawali]|uniref:Permease n=2 Tax=Mucilaginibacter gotjawali TaxID=1550579 RepID=A0A839S917_9SPHI|nr:ABC transporter permease [Mucilaginibacter gotjawali]MBB3054128.1 putative permease [Mucilaginibacter gotjawali]BAU54397.1 Macrolide export ATP-binding/permease protein MacB [Mucilaginibacter gotjawali]